MKYIGFPFRVVCFVVACLVCFIPGGTFMVIFEGRVEEEFRKDLLNSWDWVINPELHG